MDKQNEQRWAEQTQGWNSMARLFLYRLRGFFGKPAAPQKPHVTKRRPFKFGDQ